MRKLRAPYVITLLAAIGLAAPALADEAAAPERQGNPVFPKPAAVAADVADAGRAAKRRQAERREQRRGPVHPLVGQPDYGTAENAFGAARSGHSHDGQDVFAAAGTPLVAVAETEVIEAGSDGGQGNYVHLYDAKADLTYVYMHMVAPPSVKAGDRVTAGQELGGVGCTGSCWGDHLHFEVRAGRGWGGEPQDPMPLLQDWPQAESR
jgi:murein DD-endopeptidase MepM/ murein hydrolase activator NlpD